MPRFSAIAPFRIRSYRFQWPADLLISWAFEMEALILGWYVLVQTNSVGLLTVFGALYYTGTLIAPMLGVASDRVGPRILLLTMRSIYAAVAATLMVLAFTGLLSPLLVFLLAAIMGIVRPSDMGLRGALIAETMPPNLLTGAMSFSRITGDTARIAGALAGAGLFAVFGMGPAYLAITCFYLLGALLTWCTAPVKSEASVSDADIAATPATAELAPRPSSWRDLREGLVLVWNTPSLLAIMWLSFLFNLTAFSMTQGLLPYVAREVYGIDQTGLGYLVASLGAGALIGAMAMTRSGMRIPLPRLMMLSAVAWYSLFMVFAHMHSLAGGIAVLLVLGIAQSTTMVCHAVLLLQAAGARFRGRVLGVRMLAVYSLPLGMLAAGQLIPMIGFRATVSLYATTGLVCAVLIALRWRDYLWQPQAPEDAR